MNLTNLKNDYQKHKINNIIIANNLEIKTLIQQIWDERLGEYIMQRKEMLQDYKDLLNRVRYVSTKMFKTGYYLPDSDLYSALTQLVYYLETTCNQEIKYYVLARNKQGDWLPLYLTDHLVTFNDNTKGYTLSQIKEYLQDYEILLNSGIIKLEEVDE